MTNEKDYMVHLYPIIRVPIRVEATSHKEAMVKAMNQLDSYIRFNRYGIELTGDFDSGGGVVDLFPFDKHPEESISLPHEYKMEDFK